MKKIAIFIICMIPFLCIKAQESELYNRKLKAVEQVMIIDSLVVPRAQLLEHMSLSMESGKVLTVDSALTTRDSLYNTAFVTQLKSHLVYARQTKPGHFRLYKCDMSDGKWSEALPLDGLPEDETEEEGDFEDRGYEGFRWKYSIKRVFIPLPDFSTSADDGSYLDQSASMLSLAKGNIEDFFKDRIRKLTVSVFWGEGLKESEKVVFTVFLTTDGTVKTFQQYNGGNSGKGGKGGKGGDAPKNRFDPLNKGGSQQPNKMLNGGGAIKGK